MKFSGRGKWWDEGCPGMSMGQCEYMLSKSFYLWVEAWKMDESRLSIYIWESPAYSNTGPRCRCIVYTEAVADCTCPVRRLNCPKIELQENGQILDVIKDKDYNMVSGLEIHI